MEAAIYPAPSGRTGAGDGWAVPVTSGRPFGTTGFVGGPGGRQNEAVSGLITWLREPICMSLPLVWRLQLYAVCLSLVLASVPFLHLYLEVDLSLAELAIHSIDISLGALAVIVSLEVVVSTWQRGLVWRIATSRWLLTVAILLSGAATIPLQGLVHDLLPQTTHIRAKHVDAGYADMSVRVLPLIGLIGYLVVQTVQAQALRRELRRLRVLNQQLSLRPREPGAGEAGTRVPFRHEKSHVLLDPVTISHVAAEENYCRIRVEGPDRRELLVRSTLAEALAKLPAEGFRQVHRSHVVGRRHVAEILRSGRSYGLRLDGAGIVPVSRSRVAEVQAWLGASVEPSS